MQKISAGGFTLIEILIVIVIIAIMSSIVALNVGSSSGRTFKTDLFKIANFFELLADEAVYTNSVIACDVENGVHCKSYKNGEWNDLNLNKVASWKWPSNIQILEVRVAGIPLKEGERIRFPANGEMAPISFQVTDGVHKAWIDGDFSGEFKVNY